jgi:hypothetical protein
VLPSRPAVAAQLLAVAQGLSGPAAAYDEGGAVLSAALDARDYPLARQVMKVPPCEYGPASERPGVLGVLSGRSGGRRTRSGRPRPHRPRQPGRRARGRQLLDFLGRAAEAAALDRAGGGGGGPGTPAPAGGGGWAARLWEMVSPAPAVGADAASTTGAREGAGAGAGAEACGAHGASVGAAATALVSRGEILPLTRMAHAFGEAQLARLMAAGCVRGAGAGRELGRVSPTEVAAAVGQVHRQFVVPLPSPPICIAPDAPPDAAGAGAAAGAFGGLFRGEEASFQRLQRVLRLLLLVLDAADAEPVACATPLPDALPAPDGTSRGPPPAAMRRRRLPARPLPVPLCAVTARARAPRQGRPPRRARAPRHCSCRRPRPPRRPRRLRRPPRRRRRVSPRGARGRPTSGRWRSRQSRSTRPRSPRCLRSPRRCATHSCSRSRCAQPLPPAPPRTGLPQNALRPARPRSFLPLLNPTSPPCPAPSSSTRARLCAGHSARGGCDRALTAAGAAGRAQGLADSAGYERLLTELMAAWRAQPGA